jgi:hypothetical protein
MAVEAVLWQRPLQNVGQLSVQVWRNVQLEVDSLAVKANIRPG